MIFYLTGASGPLFPYMKRPVSGLPRAYLRKNLKFFQKKSKKIFYFRKNSYLCSEKKEEGAKKEVKPIKTKDYENK